MDVTFTNVLEGARQYFQGLPTATTASAAGPTYSTSESSTRNYHQHHHHPQQQQQHHQHQHQQHNNDGVPCSSAYWLPPPAQEPNRHLPVPHQQPQNKITATAAYQLNYPKEQHQPASSSSFQFPRPQSREAPSNQSQYQSHQNVYQQQTQRQDQLTPPSSSNQTYHQMQNTSNYHQVSSDVGGAAAATSRPSYYPKTTSAAGAYKVASSESSYMSQENNAAYFKDLYSSQHSHRPATTTSTTSSSYNHQSLPYNNKQHSYRPTGATASSLASAPQVSYHNSNRASSKPHSLPKQISASSAPSNPSLNTNSSASNARLRASTSYAQLDQQPQNRNSYQSSSSSSSASHRLMNQSYEYVSGGSTATTQNYSKVVVATSAGLPQSSYYQHHKLPVYEVVQQQQQVQHSARLPLAKQKRESPLDLSVKTVRTPADSTLDDTEQEAAARNLMYYRSSDPASHSSTTHKYPTYDVYASSFRNASAPLPQQQQQQRPTAPKVEFHPNFNTSHYYRRTPAAAAAKNRVEYPTVSVPTAAHVNSCIQATPAPKRVSESLPRIDFPPPGHGHKTSALYPVPVRDNENKRAADTPPPSMIPNKMSKVDTWRQSIDQQIDQRLFSYQQQQQQQQVINHKTSASSYSSPGLGLVQEKKREEGAAVYNNNAYQERQQYSQSVYNNNQYSASTNHHSQTFVPLAGAHQYPAATFHSTATVPHQYQNSAAVAKSNNAGGGGGGGGGADKRILTLLRNSLESKGAKEAAKKIEQYKHVRLDVQQPSTDVTAPFQPKPSFMNHRNNVSPFTPTNLPENNLTMYKFHLPKAIDSVNFDMEPGKYSAERVESNQASGNNNNINPNGDLDGLAAFLAARIRTKAELKQVGSAATGNNNSQQQEGQFQGGGVEKQVSASSPPKLCKEQRAFPPRRRLFSRTEDDTSSTSTHLVPARDKSGMRSSSETSVFDFPDTDSEGEMPVLERQSLEDMRRDRKAAAEMKGPASPGDDMFKQCCESFMEQLKSGSGKKRGRRKKTVRADVLAKLETVVMESAQPPAAAAAAVVKLEETDEEMAIGCNAAIKREREEDDDDDGDEDEKAAADDDDSDVPLNKLKDTARKPEGGARAPDLYFLKEVPSMILPRPAKKPSFGDGSDFCPGWEEEVYKYKKSLRMPPSLIQVTRPPQYHRLSTSLPDLDPCPHSPTPSSIADAHEYHKNNKSKIKFEHLDSDDNESTSSSFNLFVGKNSYDSEGGSSIRSLPNTTKESSSILDKLLERYGNRKKRKHKRKEEVKCPKVVAPPPKVEKLELLPTPPVKENKPEVNNIALLGFRKKTINSFKEVFMNSAKELRSRKNERRQRVTIKEVFGEDRPASAPPVTCVNSIKIKEEADLEEADTKQVLKNKLLNRGRKEGNLLKSLVDKKIKSELLDGDGEEVDSKSETRSVDGEDGGGKKVQRSKFTKIRRKFSSGFDYIRKKKKAVKKEPVEGGEVKVVQPKQQRKSSPGTVQDIQKEFKGWVLNKGIGETILHRSARLGYTDITAYCLENLECFPSPKDNAGYTPLHEASTKGHLGIAKMLLLYGANVSESARGGIRPLHEAVENGYVEVARLLLSYGADPMLATYAGMTPLALATDDSTINLLQNHINDIQGKLTTPWLFLGPASCFDAKESGFDVLDDEPPPDPLSANDDIEFEMSENLLPNLYTLCGEAVSDRWVLLQDLSNLLKIKSRDAILRQICSTTTTTGGGASSSHKSVLRELKMSDFLEQAHCCQFLNIGEKINTRASKIALVKYTDKVKDLLKVEQISISIR